MIAFSVNSGAFNATSGSIGNFGTCMAAYFVHMGEF